MDIRQKQKNDFYAVVIGGILILSVGGYFIGKTLSSDTEKRDAATRAADAVSSASILDVPLIDPETFQKKIANGDHLRIIDIRSAEEYQKEHIKDSLSLSPSALEGFSLEKDEVVVIIFSEQDPESFEVARNIFSQKSSPYFFLQGGFTAWKNSGNGTVSIGDPRLFSDQAKINYISPDELKKYLSEFPESVFLIDVQPESSFQQKHIKGAMNIPLDQLEKKIVSIHVPIARTIVVYGENDLKSFQAGVRIADTGTLFVRTLSGNDTLTSASGLPIDGTP